jgi:hypothetical protein
MIAAPHLALLGNSGHSNDGSPGLSVACIRLWTGMWIRPLSASAYSALWSNWSPRRTSAMWSGPPEKFLAQWTDVVNRQLEAGAMLSQACPSCGYEPIRCFFRRSRSNRGGSWLWCPRCKTGNHCQCVVPNWWTSVDIEESVISAEDPWSLLENYWPRITLLNPGPSTGASDKCIEVHSKK